MKNKYKTILSITGIMLFIVGIAFSYAYFTPMVENSEGRDNVVTSGSMELAYLDGDVVTLENALPGTIIDKMFTVKNVGTIKTTYDVYFSEIINGFVDTSDLVYTVESSNGCQSLEEKTIPEVTSKDSKIVNNCSINPGQKHDYTLHIKFKETNDNQDDNKGKTFSTKISLNNYKEVITNSYLLAATDMRDSFENYRNIISFKRVYDAPVNVETVDISTGQSDNPVLAWINENNEFLVYSKSKNIYFNESMKYLFTGLSKLKTADLTGFDTSLVKDMSYMFTYSSIETANLSTLNTSNVTNMEYMFSQSKFKELDLSSFDTSKVTNMRYMFEDIPNITKLNLINFNGNSVTDTSYMFAYSENLTELDISHFHTPDLVNMQDMFSGLSSLKSLNLLAFSGLSVKNASHAFSNMYSLEKINLVNFDPKVIEDVTYMFMNDKKLKTIYASGYAWNLNKIGSTGSYMFAGCTSLVGENATTYSESHMDSTYARLDKPSENKPGYFTLYRGTF